QASRVQVATALGTLGEARSDHPIDVTSHEPTSFRIPVARFNRDLTITDFAKSTGNVLVTGTLKMTTSGYLYVKGDLIVNGRLESEGLIFVEGNVRVKG